MGSLKAFPPIRGHYMYIGLLMFIVFAIIVFSVSLAIGLTNDKRIVGVIAILIIPALGFSIGLGRHVAIDSTGGLISKPRIVKRTKVELIHLGDIEFYEKIYNVFDVHSVVGVVVQLKGDKRYTYSNRKTPNCTQEIVSLMNTRRISEKIGTKRKVG